MAVLLTAVACSSGDASTPTSEATDHSAHATAAKHADGDEVVMRLIAYQPDELKVPAGTTVTWRQLDAGFHTVTSGTVKNDPSGSVEQQPDGMFASGKIAKDAAFAFTFGDAGTFPYFCEIHPATMSGRVSVA